MEQSDQDRFREHARRSYERGRVRLALLFACLAAAPLALALSIWPDQKLAFLLAALLFAALVGFVWRGGPTARGALAGLIGGSLPLVGLVASSRFGHSCGAAFCASMCVPICFVAGLAAGAYIAWRGQRSARSLEFWSAAGVAGSLTAAMACVPIGAGATLGLVIGVALAALPATVFANSSS